MKINKLNLKNFRNYSNIEIKFNKGMNIFIGDNAQGKTNLLEAIEILALTKSHRTINNDFIKFNNSKCIIKGVIKKDKYIEKLEINYNNLDRKLLFNNSIIRKVYEYISLFQVIIFTPDDLDILKGSPNIRRNLLNIELSQISKKYIYSYNEYNKILKLRNEFLKKFNNNSNNKIYLDILTDKLIEKAIVIYKIRNEFIDNINSKILKIYKEISDCNQLYIKYMPNLELNLNDDLDIKNKLKNIFSISFNKEINYGITLYGPHRDDFCFILNGNNLKNYGSQGQQKLAVLSLKLAEVDIFYNYSNYYPVLLFDDIFSEFDIKKRNKILNYINNKKIQSVITTTDLKNISKKYLDDAEIFVVKDGKIESKV